MKRNQNQAMVSFLGISPLMFLLVFPMFTFAEEKPVGKVIGITGTVEFMAGETTPVAQAKPGQVAPAAFVPWEMAKFEQPVYAKDQFRTAAASRLKIIFADQSLIALGPNSKMAVESYIYKPEEKLRQGAINVAHGLSMYIVNKSQSNAKSSFEIISPTANMSARGTNGFLSVSPENTLVANQAGDVETKNSDPNVRGEETVGAMMKNIIPKGQPPTKPVPLTLDELAQIRSMVVINVAPPSPATTKSGKTLITISHGGEKVKAEGKTEGSAPGFTEMFVATGSANITGGPHDFTPVNQPGFIPTTSGCAK